MEWLSVAEISKITRIPAPTARRYAALFREFLPSRKMGRVTKYSEDVVQIFERISSLYQDGKVTGEIEDILHKEYQRTIDVSPGQEVAQTSAVDVQLADMAGKFTDLMEKFGSCLEILANQKTMIEIQRDDIQKLKTAFVLLARSQKKLRLGSGPKSDLEELNLLAERTDKVQAKSAEIEEMALGLSFDTSDLKAKLQILESELVRLRKDRREMEKYLQEKIDRLKAIE